MVNAAFQKYSVITGSIESVCLESSFSVFCLCQHRHIHRQSIARDNRLHMKCGPQGSIQTLSCLSFLKVCISAGCCVACGVHPREVHINTPLTGVTCAAFRDSRWFVSDHEVLESNRVFSMCFSCYPQMQFKE